MGMSRWMDEQRERESEELLLPFPVMKFSSQLLPVA
jgi:hypothetical protein